MGFQTIFKRYELKYMLTLEQKEKILRAMEPYMELDRYGRSTIRNLYYDTDTYRLIRHSIEKPVYKEKLRVRSYTSAKPDSTVFVELKKKYKGIVYKRRVSLPYEEAMDWLARRRHCHLDTQITREIDYFLEYYQNLHPVVYLSYAREAYYERNGGDFRVTFDDTILSDWNNLSLTEEPSGTPLLEEGKVLMELKCSGGLPLWMTEVLTREKIYKTSYSKYGTAYQKTILQNKNMISNDMEDTAHDKLQSQSTLPRSV